MAKRRLLLADDSVTIQKVVNLTFAEEGIEVITAGDGNAAMEKFVESTPDLVMVDVNMPGLDGYRICEMIKQDDETKHIPVVLLVGSFEPFDEDEARRVGADDYLTKPFQSIRQLVGKISDLLNRSNQNDFADNQNQNTTSENQISEAAAAEYNNTSQAGNETNFELFSDVGTDDEMIQTNQIGSLPADETQKFVSEQHFQTAENNFTNWNADEEDSMKTDSFSAEDFEQNPVYSAKAETPSFDETIFEFADEQPFAQENAPEISAQETSDDKEFSESSAMSDSKNMANSASVGTTAQNQNNSFFDFDDLDLLELPSFKQESSAEVEMKTKEEIPEVSEPATVVEEKPESADTDVNAPSAASFPPEVIEAIAKMVMEKISDRVIREIAQEVTPQKLELVIKEVAQKKTN